ncbi:MAG: hypothetical protein WCV68_00930 [Candidatus Paceibacterota bacterium]
MDLFISVATLLVLVALGIDRVKEKDRNSMYRWQASHRNSNWAHQAGLFLTTLSLPVPRMSWEDRFLAFSNTVLTAPWLEEYEDEYDERSKGGEFLHRYNEAKMRAAQGLVDEFFSRLSSFPLPENGPERDGLNAALKFLLHQGGQFRDGQNFL